MESGIYKWTNKITNNVYIGQANNLERRCKEFLSFKHPYAGEKINEERQKYNSLNYWIYDILEYCDEKDLNEKEKIYIKQYQHDNVTQILNITYNNNNNNKQTKSCQKEKKQTNKDKLREYTYNTNSLNFFKNNPNIFQESLLITINNILENNNDMKSLVKLIQNEKTIVKYIQYKHIDYYNLITKTEITQKLTSELEYDYINDPNKYYVEIIIPYDLVKNEYKLTKETDSISPKFPNLHFIDNDDVIIKYDEYEVMFFDYQPIRNEAINEKNNTYKICLNKTLYEIIKQHQPK